LTRLELVENLQPELGTLSLLDPEPQDVLLAIAIIGKRDVDGPVFDQPFVAYLDPQRAKHDRVDVRRIAINTPLSTARRSAYLYACTEELNRDSCRWALNTP
jgi:hypothetical protein